MAGIQTIRNNLTGTAAKIIVGIIAVTFALFFGGNYVLFDNDANVIAFGARTTDIKSMYRMTDIFLNTEFEGGRHLTRVNKIER